MLALADYARSLDATVVLRTGLPGPARIIGILDLPDMLVVLGDGRHVPNADFEDPAGFLTRRPPADADPLETSPPITELVDPTPAVARRTVRNAARASRLDPDELEGLVFAVSEAVTNAVHHGRPPVCLRLWADPHRLVTTVTDQGHGPTDPFVGLFPTTNSSSGGLGLWTTHQMCGHVTLGSSEEGFTVRVVAGGHTSLPD